ncbi:hypothetical protein [Streptomyces curacoi]|nr:hypothetical protein [Streptomyces curacoi]
MGRAFWRTIRIAIEKDNWTARLVVLALAAGATALVACTIVTAR